MTSMDAASMSKLLHLPNELLHEVAFRLATTKLRIFSQVNHRLHDFVVDYLARYRHNTSICRLPNSVLCNILAQLDETADRCRLAQVSQKLYSTAMTFIISHDIQYVESSMLNHAVIGNLGHTARKIIRLGGNVNTMCGGLLRFRLDDDPASNKPFTPLMNAAAYEHKDMICLLLDAGAGSGQVAGGIKHALLVAMICKRQFSISMLAHKLSPEDMRDVLSSTRGVDFLTSYRWLLEHGRDKEFVRQVGSVALYDVLSEAACEGDFVKRELNEDDYQCASILLEYGADPDFCMLLHTDPAMRQVTTRHFASRHSDPRIRNLLLTAKLAAPKHDRTDLGIEQSELLAKENEDEEEEEPELEVPTPQHPNHDFWAKKPASIMLARR